MKYKSDFIVNGKLRFESLSPLDLWRIIYNWLMRSSNLGSLYKVGVGLKARSENDLGSTLLLDPEFIEDALKNDSGVPVLDVRLPQPKGLGSLQQVSYHPKRGIFNLAGKRENLPCSLESLIEITHICQTLVTVLIKPKSYISTFTAHLTPPNSNLYLAPGLANDRGNYLQGISAEMWLGESFWQYASCTKEHFLAQDWLKCDIREHHIRVEAYHEPFTTTEGEQGEIQRRLLKLLFDIDENNPCGNKGTPPQKTKEFRLEVEVDKQGNVTETKPIQETKKRWWKK